MTLAEQRLNSNHGRLVHAARDLPAHLRERAVPGSAWTARDVLAHVLAWQEEALRRLADGQARSLPRDQLDEWNARARERMRDLRWDEILQRIQAAHGELRAQLAEEPPSWFGACTYRHYTEHTRELLALAGEAAAGRGAQPGGRDWVSGRLAG
jgi:uncharacterized damage-inducible protein DinB